MKVLKKNKVCETILSQKGNNSIKVSRFILVKERNREDKFYLCCAKHKSKKYKGHATTILKNNLHYLQTHEVGKHNHAPQGSSSEVATAIASIKKCASESREKPAQLIQDNITKFPEVQPYMPFLNSLRKIIYYSRKNENLPQLQSANALDIIISSTLFGPEENSRILLLVYAMITAKSEKLYRSLSEFADEINIQLNPTWIITDFEKAVINASY
ncbi:17715_t:CDS:2, partial [Cetraspora pellucida]